MLNNTSSKIDWDPSPRAGYYQFWKRVVGVDEKLVEVANMTETSFAFTDLPGNSQVEVAIVAVNTGGESPMSQVITITTH